VEADSLPIIPFAIFSLHLVGISLILGSMNFIMKILNMRDCIYNQDTLIEQSVLFWYSSQNCSNVGVRECKPELNFCFLFQLEIYIYIPTKNFS